MDGETKTEQNTTPSLLDEVKAERERLEKARAEARAEADRLEKIQANVMLSGSAGMRPNMPQLTEEDLKKKAAIEFWKGTAIADAIART